MIFNVTDTSVLISWTDLNWESHNYYTLLLENISHPANADITYTFYVESGANQSRIISNLTHNSTYRATLTTHQHQVIGVDDEEFLLGSEYFSTSDPGVSEIIKITNKENYKFSLEFHRYELAETYRIMVNWQYYSVIPQPVGTDPYIFVEIGFLVPFDNYIVHIFPYAVDASTGVDSPLRHPDNSPIYNSALVDLSENFELPAPGVEPVTSGDPWEHLNFTAESNVDGTEMGLTWDDIQTTYPDYSVASAQTRYRYDIWMDGLEIATDVPATGNYTITGLTPGSTHNIELKVLVKYINSIVPPRPTDILNAEWLTEVGVPPIPLEYVETAVAATAAIDPPGEFVFITYLDIPEDVDGEGTSPGLVIVKFKNGFMASGLSGVETTKQISKEVLVNNWGFDTSVSGIFTFDPTEYGL